MCRWCKGAVSGRRRTFCSDACVHEWRLRSSPTYLRECVYARDQGICALCGINRRWLRGKWQADHILPVVEGGDSNLENMRTLCIPCHRGVTTELRLRLKARRASTRASSAAAVAAGRTTA
jgi:5-methylcytosine-specific restriction endonuclease McrA